MGKLTKDYLSKRRSSVHTAESFGRAVFELALRAAEEKLGSGEADSIEIDDIKLIVEPFEAPERGLFCVKVCVRTPLGEICHHEGI